MKKYGYYGRVRAKDFITGKQLIDAIGLHCGYPINHELDWFHFNLNGEEIMIPMKPLIHSLSWTDLYQAGVVYSDTEGYGPYFPFPLDKPKNQNVFIDIEGNRYKVTLIKGLSQDSNVIINPSSGLSMLDEINQTYINHNTTHSEWNQLMYRVLDKKYRNITINQKEYSITENEFGVWENFDDVSLNRYSSIRELGEETYKHLKELNDNTESGKCDETLLRYMPCIASWCQESVQWKNSKRLATSFENRKIVRGGGITITTTDARKVEDCYYAIGWRPALRKT